MISDPALAAVVAAVLIVVFSLGSIGGRAMKPPAAHDERIRAVESRIGDVEHRLEAVQQDGQKTKHDVGNMRMVMQRLATTDAVNDIKVQVGQLSGEVRGVTASLSAVHASVDRVERFLMEATARQIVAGKQLGGDES